MTDHTVVKTICRKRLAAVALPISLLLAGCGSLTGLEADSDFRCEREDGLPCRSLKTVYETSVAGGFDENGEKDGKALVEREDLSREETPVRQKTDTAKNAHGVRGSETDALSKSPVRESRYDPSVVISHLTLRPERIPEVIVTIWLSPWTDEEGDFHEGERIHARVSDSLWAAARRRAERTDGRRAVVMLPFNRERTAAVSEEEKTGEVPARRDADGPDKERSPNDTLRKAAEDYRTAVREEGLRYGKH